MAGRFLLALLLTMIAELVCGAQAHAQESVWFASAADRQSPSYAALRAGLETEGVLVRELSPSECGTALCALERVRTTGLRFSVRAELTAASDATRAVRVTVTSRTGRSGEGTGTIVDGGVAAAVRSAYRQAELALSLGAQALLRVQTRPQSALVSLDGTAIGLSPLDRKVEPGEHEVTVSLDDFVSERRKATLEGGRVNELEFTLTRAAALAADAGPASRPSALNWIAGGVLVAGSVPLLASSIVTLANDGECARHDRQGHCTGRVHFGTRSALFFGFGAAALLGGSAIFVFQPFRVAPAAGPHQAGLSFEARL